MCIRDRPDEPPVRGQRHLLRTVESGPLLRDQHTPSVQERTDLRPELTLRQPISPLLHLRIRKRLPVPLRLRQLRIPQQPGQPTDGIRHGYPLEHPASRRGAPRTQLDGPLGGEVMAEAAGNAVRDRCADQDQTVRVLDGRPDPLVADLPGVGADEPGSGLVQYALPAGEHGGPDRRGGEQTGERPAQPEPFGLVPGQHGDAARPVQQPRAAVEELPQQPRIGGPVRHDQRPLRRRHPSRHHIRGQIQVHRPALPPHGPQYAVDLGRGVLRGQVGAGHRHLGEHPAEVPVLAVHQGVVHGPAGRGDLGGGHPGDGDDRHPFGVCAGHAVDGRQFADAEGGDEGGGAAQPGVAVGGVGGVQLVAGTDPGEAGEGGHLIEEAEVVVAGDAEEVFDVQLAQPAEQIVGDGDPSGRGLGGGGLRADVRGGVRHGGNRLSSRLNGLGQGC